MKCSRRTRKKPYLRIHWSLDPDSMAEGGATWILLKMTD